MFNFNTRSIKLLLYFWRLWQKWRTTCREALFTERRKRKWWISCCDRLWCEAMCIFMSDICDRVLTEVKVPPLGLPLFHCPSDSASTPPEPLWYPYEVLLLPSLITRSREWQAIYQEYLLYMLYLMSGGNTMKPLVIKLKIEEDFHWRYSAPNLWLVRALCYWWSYSIPGTHAPLRCPERSRDHDGQGQLHEVDKEHPTVWQQAGVQNAIHQECERIGNIV